MSKPRLILHAGTHKTGTTAIQRFAMRNREALAARGWIYPGLAPFAEDGMQPHHRFAFALTGTYAELSRDDATALPLSWAKALPVGASVFVSAEPIYRLTAGSRHQPWESARRAYLRRLGAALAPFDVEAVLVFRRPDEFTRSLFQENVRKEPKPRWTTLGEFHQNGELHMLRYARNAELIAEIFPNTRVMIYEDLVAGDAGLCPAFFASLGIDVSGLPEPGRVRSGISPELVAAKILLGAVKGEEMSNQAMMKRLRSRRVTRALERHLGAGPFGWWPNVGARDALLAARAADIERLRTRFLPERAALFPLPAAQVAPPVPDFPPALVDAIVGRGVMKSLATRLTGTSDVA